MRTRRRWRWADGYYHVCNRGSRRLDIFSDARDRLNFLRLMGQTALKQNVSVVAYELMDNHYHAIVKGDGAAIGRMFRDLEKTYSRQFNARVGGSGTLFEGRFYAGWLPDLEIVAYVSRYIHANCRDKGIAPEGYTWSSLGAFLGRTWTPAWLDPAPVLERVGGREAYRRYMKEAPPIRRKGSPQDEAQAVFIENLVERLKKPLEEFPEEASRLSVEMLACWVGIRAFGLRPRVLARVFGFSSGRSVSVGVIRMEGYLKERPDLRARVSEVLIK